MATIRIKRTGSLANPLLKAGELGLIGNNLYYGKYSNGDTPNTPTAVAVLDTTDNVFINKNTFKPASDGDDAVLFQNAGGTTFYKSLAGRLQTHGTFTFNDADLVNKAYVDGRTQGLAIKTAVRLGSTEEFPSTYNSIGKTLTATSTGSIASYFDGTNPVPGDRVLVKNQTNNIYNGIYTVTTAGFAGVAAVLTRATDADTTAELLNAYVFINIGTTLADTS
jgi:hypothetical protein